MIMKYLQDKTTKNEPKRVVPNWVSEQNASYEAWLRVEKLKQDRIEYIESHYKATHFLKKSLYQITPAQVARAIEIHRSTLMHSSSYSEEFGRYLTEVNLELNNLKIDKLKASRKSPSRGVIQSSKNELLQLNSTLRKKLAEVELQKTDELVKLTFDQLPLPVRQKLGI